MTLVQTLKFACVTSLAATALSACHANLESKSESYAYDLTENGCPTGSKTFSDKGAYCEALKNDATNNYCAENLRMQKYNQECAGAALTNSAVPPEEANSF